MGGYGWIGAGRVAHERGDWDLAIATVEPHAQCYSVDHERHNAHLWHLDLLVKAGRLDELALLGRDDVHARRRLNRHLYETGQRGNLARRAEAGDEGARILHDRLRLEQNDGRNA
ncbi:hypothetical protein [Catellatospora sichuanensis]|uniref:hypothetical protein n=1 Tax=Catellatospora sichuanensis TaxID=1969805 RepID=UPI0011844F49|nr:hypothetical protein [Catellatospora sichuanensis]